MEVEESSSPIEIDENVNESENYFADNITDEDLVFTIPKASKVLLYHGQSLSDSDWIRPRVNGDIKVQYHDRDHALKEPYKYMSAKMMESNEALNEYLDAFVFAVKARCRDLSETVIEDEEFRNIVIELADESTLSSKLSEKNAMDNYFIGRIRFSYTNKKLNSRNVYLESSGFYSEVVEVVPLDFSLFKDQQQPSLEEKQPKQLPMVSLFPGQIVLIKAENPLGTSLRVTRFIELSDIFQPNFSPKCPKVLLNNEPVSIVCASGPFVSFDATKQLNLTDTTYMVALANYLKHYKPDVLLIFGPFLEEEYADQIAEWAIRGSQKSSSLIPQNWTLEKLFNHQFRALGKELEGLTLHTQILFIPSANEFGANNIFPTFPENIKQRVCIQSFSNPSLLDLGGISIGACSTDILLHMSRYETSNVSKNGDQAPDKKSDRLRRMCAHLLDHKSFYPLLPPDRSVNLESSMYHHLTMPVTPHFLFLPSILRPFVYNIDNTIVINPGKVAKNSIARIMIDPLKDATQYNGSISQYVNVEIIKLLSNESN